MNCKEIDIWLTEASDEQLIEPSIEVAEHLSACEHCTQSVLQMRQAIQFIHDQRNEVLGEKKTEKLIQQLKIVSNNSRPLVVGKIFISRMAAIFIISFGLLLGILAGGFFSTEQDTDNIWSEEFSLLSDNSDSMFD